MTSPGDRGDWRALLAIAFVSVLCYSNTLSNGWVGDDYLLLLDPTAIHDVTDLPEILGSSYWGQDDGLYRPLTSWSFALNFGLNRALGQADEQPFGFHLFNLLAHLAVGLALYRLLSAIGLDRSAALAGSLIFAAHPLHTEAVAMVVGRAELLAALGGLAFLVSHRTERSAALAGACLFLALLGKESAIVYLPLAVWLDASMGRGDRRFRPRAYAVYATTALAWFALRAWALGGTQEGTPFIDNPLVGASITGRWLTAAGVQLDYLRLQFLPIGLSSDYSYAQIPLVATWLAPRVLAFVALVIIALWAAWWLHRTDPVVTFALVGYAILFAVTSNFLFPIGTIMGERLVYSPSIALSILVGYGISRSPAAWRGLVAGALVVVLLVFCALTVRRNRSWHDWESYVSAQLRSAPQSAKAHYNMAVLRFEAEDFEASAASSRRAAEIFPGYAEAWDRLGSSLAALGQFVPAIEAHQQALTLFPGFSAARDNLAETHYGLGLARQREGRLDEAAAAYRAAIDLRADWAPPLSNLGVLHAMRGDLDEAERLWRQALAIDPDYPVARNNLELLERSRRP